MTPVSGRKSTRPENRDLVQGPVGVVVWENDHFSADFPKGSARGPGAVLWGQNRTFWILEKWAPDPLGSSF